MSLNLVDERNFSIKHNINNFDKTSKNIIIINIIEYFENRNLDLDQEIQNMVMRTKFKLIEPKLNLDFNLKKKNLMTEYVVNNIICRTAKVLQDFASNEFIPKTIQLEINDILFTCYSIKEFNDQFDYQILIYNNNSIEDKLSGIIKFIKKYASEKDIEKLKQNNFFSIK